MRSGFTWLELRTDGWGTRASSCHRFIKDSRAGMRPGFTWLELLLATSVAAVFLALAQGPLLHFSSLLADQYTTSAKQRQLDRFLLMLKAELIQA